MINFGLYFFVALRYIHLIICFRYCDVLVFVFFNNGWINVLTFILKQKIKCGLHPLTENLDVVGSSLN